MEEREFNKYIKRLKTDKKAFDKLYNYYFPKIVTHIYVQYRDKELSRDVAQEFFVKLLSEPKIEHIYKPNSWVYTVAENIAKNMIRKYKTQQLTEATKLSVSDEYGYELYGEYWDKLNELDETTRRIVTMRAIERYRFDNIAAELDMKVATVRKKYSRAIKKLRE